MILAVVCVDRACAWHLEHSNHLRARGCSDELETLRLVGRHGCRTGTWGSWVGTRNAAAENARSWVKARMVDVLNRAVRGVGNGGLEMLARVGHETIAVIGHDDENGKDRTAYSMKMDVGEGEKRPVSLRVVEGLVWDEKVVVGVAVWREARLGSGVCVRNNEALTSVEARGGVGSGKAMRLVNILLLAQGRMDA